MLRKRRRSAAALVAGLLALAPNAFGQAAPLSAREHFARGYALAQNGDPNAAIIEFEQAYAASPNPSVLYNLGLAYAAAGRSSEAVETLKRYLAQSGASNDDARTRQIEALISYHSERVGKLAIQVTPPAATLSVDGRALGSGSQTVALNPGAHGLMVTAPGFEPLSVPVSIVTGQLKSLDLHLAPRATPAALQIRCQADGVTISVDGAAIGKTPQITAIPATSGSHRVRFERPGYLPDEQAVELPNGETGIVTCRLRIDPGDSSHGKLTISHPEGTRVFLDDAPFEGAPVPRGPHRLSVLGPEYSVETRRIVLGPREQAHLTLVPLRDPQRLVDEHERTRHWVRIGSLTLAAVGVATAVTATALYIDNNARYSAWQAKSRKSVSTLPTDPNAANALDALLAEENSIRHRDSVALGLTVFSCAALATSAVLFLSSQKHEERLVITAGTQPGIRYERQF